MKNKTFILTGPTGSGKTYNAFKHCNSKQKVVYLAPCRQLVYESFVKYHSKGDSLYCSDIHINGHHDHEKSNWFQDGDVRFFGLFSTSFP